MGRGVTYSAWYVQKPGLPISLQPTKAVTIGGGSRMGTAGARGFQEPYWQPRYLGRDSEQLKPRRGG